MKKILLSLLAIVFVLALCVPAMAATEAPQITMQPQNYHYPEYSVAMYTVEATGTNLQATWYLEYEGKTYNISDYTNGFEPWEAYAGESYGPNQPDDNTFICFFGGIEAGLNGAEIWCVIEDGHYDVTSERAIITVQGDAMPPEILDMPARLTVNRGDSVEVRCLAKTDRETQLEYIWYETATGKLQDIQAIEPEETGDFLICSTELVGTRYYVCGITTTDGGRAYSSVLPVEVLDFDPEPVEDPTTEATEPEETTAAPTTPSEPSEETTPQIPQDNDDGIDGWVVAAVGVAAAALGVGVTLLLLKKKK